MATDVGNQTSQEEGGFLPEDFAFTAELLRTHTKQDRQDLFRAVCSYNLNIILTALDRAGAQNV